MKERIRLLAAETDLNKQHQLILNYLSQVREEGLGEEELSARLQELATDVDSYTETELQIACIVSSVLYELMPLGNGTSFANRCLSMLSEFRKIKGITCSELIYKKLGKKKMTVVREPSDVGFPQVPVSFCAFVGESSILVLSDGRCESKCGGNAGEKCGGNAGEKCGGNAGEKRDGNAGEKRDGNAGEKCNNRCKGEEIVAYREPSGTLVLVMVMHQSEPFLASDYEINELSEEVPLTFTLNTHYYSPMYRLKAMREVIEALMVKYDYPKVRIKLQVFYSDERAFVQNPEENEAFWSKEDMEYVHPSSFPQGVLQGVSGSVYPRAFLELMKKAAEVFTHLPVNKLYTAEQIQMLIRD